MMPLYLFDTNTVSAVMANHAKVKGKLSLQPGQVVTCAIVRGEIHYGSEWLPADKRRTNLQTKAAVVFATLPIEPITPAARQRQRSLDRRRRVISRRRLGQQRPRV